MVEKQTGVITFKGNPMTLLGTLVKKGDPAPDFAAVATDLSTKRLSDAKGKTVVLVTVPSLDTGVCDTEAKRFNTEAANLGDDIEVWTISMDLPFAQKRWCGSLDAQNIITLSDYKERAVGKHLGLMIEELGLLTRAVVVVGPDQTVQYVQVVPEVTNEPDYDAALAAAKQAAG